MLSSYLIFLVAVTTPWDVERFAEKVKNIPVDLNGGKSSSDESLLKYFQDTKFGDIYAPAVIMDCHGRILAWHLPGALTVSRVVRLFSASTSLMHLI
jgi:hypothetical protein